jgi:SAM-dependent methyltransferase
MPAMTADSFPQSFLDMPAECPICGTTVDTFLPFGARTPAPDRKCPTCGSLERHRMLWLYFAERTNLFQEPLRMLHIAPESCLAPRLQEHDNIDYLSADIESPAAMVKMDITDIHFPADSFDVIYASHVLEHIPDDRLAMRELNRVLRAGGWAILQVPIWGDTTREDPTVTDPKERERLFGQFDHVRMYGNDGVYAERLRGAGFEVNVDNFVLDLGPERARRYRLSLNEDIYHCSKPGTPPSQGRAARTLRSATYRARREFERVRGRLGRAS